VSNFELNQIEEVRSYLSKVDIAAVQNRYGPSYRVYERDVIPYSEEEGMLFMAYTPLEKGSLAKDQRLAEIGHKYGKNSGSSSFKLVNMRQVCGSNT